MMSPLDHLPIERCTGKELKENIEMPKNRDSSRTSRHPAQCKSSLSRLHLLRYYGLACGKAVFPGIDDYEKIYLWNKAAWSLHFIRYFSGILFARHPAS